MERACPTRLGRPRFRGSRTSVRGPFVGLVPTDNWGDHPRRRWVPRHWSLIAPTAARLATPMALRRLIAMTHVHDEDPVLYGQRVRGRLSAGHRLGHLGLAGRCTYKRGLELVALLRLGAAPRRQLLDSPGLVPGSLPCSGQVSGRLRHLHRFPWRSLTRSLSHPWKRLLEELFAPKDGARAPRGSLGPPSRRRSASGRRPSGWSP